MNCSHCSQSFSPRHLPRILTKCGHSYCTPCLLSLLQATAIVCPECGKTTPCNVLSELPLNQALLTATRAVEPTNTLLCTPHKRPAEAFCSTDKEPLCVDCIIQGVHKPHEIEGLALSAKRERERVAESRCKAELLRVKLELMRGEVEKITREKQGEMETAVGEIELLFDSICAAAKFRESQLKFQFQQQLDAICESNRVLKQNLSRQIAAIERLSQEAAFLDQESIPESLSKAKSRSLLCTSALPALEPFPTQKGFLFSKETELTTLFKTLKGQLARSNPGKKSSISPSLRINTQESAWPGSPKPTHTKAYSSAASSPAGSPTRASQMVSRSPMGYKSGARSPSMVKVSVKNSDMPPRHGLKRTGGTGRDGGKKRKEEVVVLFGGITDKPTQIEVYHPSSHSWSQGATLGLSRSSFATADGLRTADSESISLSRLAPSPEITEVRLSSPRSQLSCVRVEDELIIAGGDEGTAVRKVEAFGKQGWRTLPSLVVRREDFGLVITPDKRLMAVGGFGGAEAGCVRNCEVFGIAGSEWTQVASLAVPRRGLGAVALPSGVYAIGGFDGEAYLSSVERFDYFTQIWHPAGKLTTGRSHFSTSASSDGQSIYIFGGYNGISLNTIEEYIIAEDRWRVIGTMPNARYCHGCAATVLE